MRRVLSLLLPLAIPATAFGQDAGPSADAGSGCGNITFAGECSGTTLTYCDEDLNELVSYDCAVEWDPSATCQEISPSYGVDCVLPPGAECVVPGIDGLFAALCAGNQAGCVETLTGSACTENLTACTDQDPPECRGNLLFYTCTVNQPWLVDCSSLGGSCASAACVGLPEGSFCGDGFECAAGLVCDPNDGECVAGTPGTDAGTGTPDGGTPVGNDASAPDPDAGTVRPDASAPADGGTTPSDAGTTPSDAGTPPSDAGASGPDAAAPADAGVADAGQADAGPGTPDSSTSPDASTSPDSSTSPDAGAVDTGTGPGVDAGSPGVDAGIVTEEDGGCGCSATERGRAGFAPWALAPLLFWFIRRRRI